jgi:O-antigen/teichoic acid export membrane protein
VTDDVPEAAPRRSLAGGTTWIAIGSTVNGLAAFGFQVVGTRALGPTAYAPIGVLWTLQYLWIAVAVTAVEAYVTRMTTVSGPRSPELARFLRLFGRWLLLTGTVTAAGGWLLRDLVFDGIGSLGLALGLVVIGYGWYAVIRGRAAGDEAFRAYGLATAAESVLRLVTAAVVLAITATTRSLGWVFPVGPLAVIAWVAARSRPRDRARHGPTTGDRPRDPTVRRGSIGHDPSSGSEEGRRHGRRFLASASTANASVQVLLAGGPLVLLPLGADAVAISIFFTTITAARVPMTFALNGGLARLLPPLTRLSEVDDTEGIRRTSARLVAGIIASTVVAVAGAAAIGPEVIALLFGAGFRPERPFVVLVVAGTVLAVGGLLLDQIYIATGRENRLPAVWVLAVVVAGVLVLLLPGTPTMRVATAFTLATAGAVAVLSIPVLRGRRTH